MPLSSAERQRRYIARLKEQAAKAGPGHAALVKELARVKTELAQAKARIAELEKDAKRRAKRAAKSPATLTKTKDKDR
jgi:hypothetical protein